MIQTHGVHSKLNYTRKNDTLIHTVNILDPNSHLVQIIITTGKRILWSIATHSHALPPSLIGVLGSEHTAAALEQYPSLLIGAAA